MGPYVQRASPMDVNGTISPLSLRKYHRLKSSGFMRNGASACTYTFLTRLRSTKSLTYFLIDAHFQLRAVVLPEGPDVPQQRAAPRQFHQLIPRRDEGFMPEPRLILQLEVKAGGVAERTDRRWCGDEYPGIDD